MPGFCVYERFGMRRLEPYITADKVRCAMTPETEGKEEKGPSGLPFINDPGNEDPGSLMDDATVPLNDADDAGDVGNIGYEEEDAEEDEQ
jgi:hypothetical protein